MNRVAVTPDIERAYERHARQTANTVTLVAPDAWGSWRTALPAGTVISVTVDRGAETFRPAFNLASNVLTIREPLLASDVVHFHYQSEST